MTKYENIRKKLKVLSSETNYIDFVFDFLRAFDFPEATISRIKLNNNKEKDKEQRILVQNKLLFTSTEKLNLNGVFEDLREHDLSKWGSRFIVIVNTSSIYGFDLHTEEALVSRKNDIYNYVDFFLPLIGIKKVDFNEEKSANEKAAEKFATLYNTLYRNLKAVTPNSVEGLNTTISRILFCFYFDGNEIIESGHMHHLLSNYSDKSGSDLKILLQQIFDVIVNEHRGDLPTHFAKLPKVNNILFSHNIDIPEFDRSTRKILLEISEFNWSSLNPDILGSLIQSVILPDDTSGLANHFTSASNTLRVFGPLFLDDFYEIMEANISNLEGLRKLLNKLSYLAVFDPVCGSGYFLIAAFKELKKLERELKKAIKHLDPVGSYEHLGISLDQFYGIEPNHFKTQIASIGLWAEYFQANRSSIKNISELLNSFNSINIVCENPLRVSWTEFCKQESSIYIVCNPTYKGSRKQTKSQKEDIAYVFEGFKKSKNLDYSACWLYLSAKFIKEKNAFSAIVATNSMTQGEQVNLLWPRIYNLGITINFAHTSFKWKNSPKGNTGVTVVIIGLGKDQKKSSKKLFTNKSVIKTSDITPYLSSGKYIEVKPRTSTISSLPQMPKGNMPYDAGNLILSSEEVKKMMQDFPKSKPFIKRLMGSKEFIQDINRWCLWIRDDDLDDALEIPPIKERVEAVKKFRMNNTDSAAKRLADRPHQFRETNETISETIIIPSVSSERREYIPIGFVDSSVIITNLAFAIYDCSPWVFGIITSKMHMVWIRAVCGSLETRIRYSSRLGYNTFPFPDTPKNKKELITECVYSILEIREKNSEKSMSQMYDPDFMSDELLAAHKILDKVIENCYTDEKFFNDKQRLEFLFKEYKKNVGEKDD